MTETFVFGPGSSKIWAWMQEWRPDPTPLVVFLECVQGDDGTGALDVFLQVDLSIWWTHP